MGLPPLRIHTHTRTHAGQCSDIPTRVRQKLIIELYKRQKLHRELYCTLSPLLRRLDAKLSQAGKGLDIQLACERNREESHAGRGKVFLRHISYFAPNALAYQCSQALAVAPAVCQAQCPSQAGTVRPWKRSTRCWMLGICWG